MAGNYFEISVSDAGRQSRLPSGGNVGTGPGEFLPRHPCSPLLTPCTLPHKSSATRVFNGSGGGREGGGVHVGASDGVTTH